MKLLIGGIALFLISLWVGFMGHKAESRGDVVWDVLLFCMSALDFAVSLVLVTMGIVNL